MVDRTLFWDENQSRTFDYVQDSIDTMKAISQLALDILGQNATVASGLTATASDPANLSIALAAGSIYQLADIDATTDGAISQNTAQILQQGIIGAQTITLSTAGLSVGQSRWQLIEAQFSQQDNIRAGDPNGGLLFFYNSANPLTPFEGPGGNDSTTPTVRQGLVTIQVIAGAPATTGSETPPTPSSGWTPLYLIDLSFGQTTIIQSQILQAGPSVGTGVPSNYPAAPFIAGLTNSHHGGIAGQAPKIKLGSEVQGVLPIANGGSSYGFYSDTGTADAMVVNLSPAPASLASMSGVPFLVQKAATNTSGTITLTLNGFTAAPVLQIDGGQFPIGSWLSTTFALMTYNAGSNTFFVINIPDPSNLASTAALTAATAAITSELPPILTSQCRLAATSPTNLVLLPYNGNLIRIAGSYYPIPAGGVAISNAGLAASTVYYVYASQSAGVVSLTLTGTGHQTDTTSGNIGVEIISGNNAYTLVGMIFTSAAAQFASNPTYCGVLSWFNRQTRPLQGTTGSGITTTSTTPVELSSTLRVLFITWGDEAASFYAGGVASNNATGNSSDIQVGVDGSPIGLSGQMYSAAANQGAGLIAVATAFLTEGAHYVTAMGAVSTGTGSYTITVAGSITG